MSEERITSLEIKFIHQDQYLEELNKIVVDQQKRIERLEADILALRKMSDGAANSTETKPPHY